MKIRRRAISIVLKSLSQNPDIAPIHDLYKIGFSTVPVEGRIKTYPAKSLIIFTIKIYN